MHFFGALFVLLGLALLQTAQAFRAGHDWVVLSTQETTNGTLTFHGPRLSAPAPALAERGRGPCGDVVELCSDTDKWQADVGVCSSLINTLVHQSEWGVTAWPRAICLMHMGDQCCVSWAQPVYRNFRQGHLVSSARQVLNKCKNNLVPGKVSAIAYNILLNDVCNSQCLSNRPDGCG